MAVQVYQYDVDKMRRAGVPSFTAPPGRGLTASTGVTSQVTVIEQLNETACALLRAVEEVKKPRTEGVGIFRINLLPNKKICEPIEAILERDDEGFIARTIELPLYGCGADPMDAIEMLKSEIESLYDDLMVDDNFTDDWIRAKEYLNSKIEG
jgi:hypothetical protein